MRLIALFSFFLAAAVASHADPYDEFLKLYAEYGNEKYMIQEEIVQSDHVLQAACIAKLAGAPEDVIVALLFHDVGQVAISDNVGNVEILHPYHDEIGAEWLEARSFPPFVCSLVKDHALAKLFLCRNDAEYFKNLSEASQISYRFQKEKYDKSENRDRVAALEQNPRKQDIIAARKCDDMAKIPGWHPPGFERYRLMTERVVSSGPHPEKTAGWRSNIDALYRWMTNDRASFEKWIRQSYS